MQDWTDVCYVIQFITASLENYWVNYNFSHKQFFIPAKAMLAQLVLFLKMHDEKWNKLYIFLYIFSVFKCT